MRKKIKKNKRGFTLVEVLVSLGILAIAVASTMQLMIFLVQLSETNDIMLPTMNSLEGIMDEIRNAPFEDITSAYDDTTFTLDELDGRGIQNMGVITVDTIEANYLLRVKIVLCWKQKNRVMGEDKNFNGLLDLGEDENGNNELDSPCSIEGSVRWAI
ncbi:MAG: prepilin-type N-terminal cleavage/methylation domain-containing protein [Candidatus Omnitrophica bacterium]|nr:prepilin-type N-terminal cleavage/methylation domain-containing protein [Candidatus Omnitrophota bacterium]MBU1925822.1 prepilin-type N-terminal cleavage/methylation domain-containing protein [Candidatus Omnitrophota bacterium]